MKATLEELFRDTLQAIELKRILPQRLRLNGSFLSIDDEQVDLDAYDRIAVAALGKAAYTMTAALSGLLAPRRIYGVAVGPDNQGPVIPGIKVITGEHPYPGPGSLDGANSLLASVSNLGQRDLVIFLLSGGGSSLAECPCDATVSLADIAQLHRLLVTSGAPIGEMNVVRKHLSGIKGGRLAVAAAPARQITLYVSDVPANQPSAVASGPTMPDESSLTDAIDILQHLRLIDALPDSIRHLLEQRHLTETPKPNDNAFARSGWHCLLDNQTAIDQLRQQAQKIGWLVETDCSVDDSPLADAVDALITRLRKLAAANPGRTVCVISGGELSCPVTGDGIGGRNQAFVLHAASKIAGTGITVLSAGTDGIDGNSPAAGAIADGLTISRAEAAGLDANAFELRSDACNFFRALDDLIVTGPTGNNVRDLRLLVSS